jgi:hypothetical protein
MGRISILSLSSSIPNIISEIASCKLLTVLAICFLMGKCDALLLMHRHKNTQHVATKLTFQYATISQLEKIVTYKDMYHLYPISDIKLMSTRMDDVDNGTRNPPEQQQQQQSDIGGSIGGDYSVMGKSSSDDDTLSYAFPQQQSRNRLADRIRQLHQQQQEQRNIDNDGDATSSSSSSSTTTSENTSGSSMSLFENNSTDDSNELYLQVKQGIVQIKSKEQHSYVL